MANFKKLRTVTLTDETAASGITYVGTAKIPSGVSLTTAKALAIWQIHKYVKSGTGTVITEQRYAYDSNAWYSNDMIFVWNNRASLTYDA